jgi:hypothetical protein
VAFNASRQRLLEHGINYPAKTDGIERINIEKYNPGGNAMIPRVEPFGDGLRRIMSRNQVQPDRHLFLSGELIYHHLEEVDILPDLRSILGSYGFDDIRLLLFVRDPLPLFVSGWQQRLRSQGTTSELSTDPDKITWSVRAMLRALEKLRAAEGITLTVHSYDRPGAPLIELVEQWLELPAGTMSRPPQARANRSFTRSEALLALAVNRAVGRRTEFGQKLIARVQDPAPDPLGLSAGVQDRAVDALAAPLSAVNALLPEHAHLRATRVPVVDWTAPAVFSGEQLAVIAEILTEGLAPPPQPRNTTAPVRRAVPLWRKALRPFDLRRWL